MNIFEYMLRNWAEVAELTLEHLVLVGISTSLAILIGFPLGVIMTRRESLSRPILTFANIMQTIPSLALFGFLIPIPFIGGIGARTAIVALLLYSLLPIIRNTYTGITHVDPAVREAALGMGMTDRQLLMRVEIPLAMGRDLCGDPGRHRYRGRFGDDRRCNRSRRFGHLHIQRGLDGRFTTDSGRRRTRGGDGPARRFRFGPRRAPLEPAPQEE